MAVVNVTPDSFSDGGAHLDPEDALAAAHRMILEGADVLDLGAESSRPGSDPVSVDEELRRLGRVLPQVLELGAPVSIDTTKPEVAAWCLQQGAHLINDITGLGDEMIDVARNHGVPCIVMHMSGRPKTMQRGPHYEDVVAEIHDFLAERVQRAEAEGVQTVVDPGFGFGKSLRHNLDLLRRLDVFRDLGPVLVGISRKSMLGALTGAETSTRLPATLASSSLALDRGASILRVHDVAAHRQLLQVHGGCLGFELATTEPARIHLDGIEATLHLGVPDEERAHPQTITVDLELEVSGHRGAAATDHIEKAVDYAPIPDLVRRTCAARPVRLLERLAQRIADEVLAHTEASAVRVRLHKPGAANELGIADVSYELNERASETAPDPPSGDPLPTRVAAIALGSNLGARRHQLDAAVAELRRLGIVLAVSDWIETDPEHGVDQPRYLNGAVTLRTTLLPTELMDELLTIERRFGRRRSAEPDVAATSRTLDLDLLLMDDLVLDHDDLTLPHPRMADRDFVLGPLAQIAPDWRHPVLGERIAGLRAALDGAGRDDTSHRTEDRQGPN